MLELNGYHRLALSVYPTHDSPEDGGIWGQSRCREPFSLADSPLEFSRKKGLPPRLALGDEGPLERPSRSISVRG